MKFIIHKIKNGNWGWRLKAKNGETVASGEGYKRKADAVHAVKLVMASGEASVEVV